MHTANSRGRDGFRVAQDFRKPKGGGTFSGGVVDVSERAGLYCLRVIDRGKYGHYETEEELAGDMLGAFVQVQEADKRPIPAWGYVRGSVVGGNGGGPTTGGATVPVAVAGGGLGMTAQPVNPAAAQATPDPAKVQPQYGPRLRADDRFKPFEFPWTGSQGATQPTVESRVEGTTGAAPQSWPAFPVGYTGLVVASSDELRQIVAFHPTDPRLIAPNRGGVPAYGTTVVDLFSRGGIDEFTAAPLQSVFRVVLRPRGARGLQNNTANVIGIQIGRSGLADSPGTVFVDGGEGGKSAVLARPSVRDDGPFDCVRGGCKHTNCADGDGNPISPLHFSDKTLFRTGNRAPVTTSTGTFGQVIDGIQAVKPTVTATTAPGGVFDGPIDFETPWPNPNMEGPYPVLCHIGWDAAKTYRLSRDGQETPYSGAWRIWTGVYIGTNDTPGRSPTTIDEPREPRDPPPPPPPGGPATPGGDNTTTPTTPDGGVPGSPPGDGPPGPLGPGAPGGDNGGIPNTPPAGGGVGSGDTNGPTPPSPDGENGGGTTTGKDTEDGGPSLDDLERQQRESDDFYRRIQEELRRLRKKREQDKEATAHIQPGSSAMLVPRVQGVTPLETVFPSVVARPQIMAAGEFDLRVQPQSPPGAVTKLENANPQTLRTEAFGKQSGATFTYTQPPGNSRSLSGTASGGTMDLPPEHDMTDVAFNASYGDTTSMTGASTSSRVIGYGVTLAFGKPSVTTGKPYESVGIVADYTNKSAKVRYYDTGGTGTDIVEIKSGEVTVADQVNIATSTGTGTMIAATSSQKIGFFGTAPTTQPSAVADAAGGAVIDDEARTAINTLLARLRTLGIIDT